ncbi:HAD family hydrolase (plasmid) [Streptomyces avidinii]|uniref:HAD family hydrolase n=1 Tax=Streptomyces avidinii TaxID=1895 RepID=UPI002F907FBE|nr:HAD family hydrolase [Streptomyces avidinii]
MNLPDDHGADGGAALLADTLTLSGPGPVLLDGFDVVLVDPSQAREAVARLDKLVGLAAVGTVFTHDDAWGFFLPTQSGDPAWPTPARHVAAGSTLTLPPAPQPHAAKGWIRWSDGPIYTAPLLLHAVLADIAARQRPDDAPASPPAHVRLLESPAMPAPKIAFFDLDDTLTDHATSFRRWAEEFAARYGMTQHEVEDAEVRCAGQRDAFFADLKTRHDIQASIAALHAQYRHRSAQLVPHRPQVCTAIRSLRDDGWRLGVITNGDPSTQRLKLRTARLDDLFEAVVISGEYGIRKPDRGLYRIALDALDTSSGFMVGDDLQADVAGGAVAGLRTVWIAAGRDQNPSSPTPDHTVQTVLEAIELLRENARAFAAAAA